MIWSFVLFCFLRRIILETRTRIQFRADSSANVEQYDDIDNLWPLVQLHLGGSNFSHVAANVDLVEP